MTRRAADLLISGRVATLAGERGFGWQEALAIAEGRVMAAGRLSDVDGLAGPRTVRWRLPRTQVVLPGITDAHLHLMMLVRARREADLSGAPDVEACLAALRDADNRLRAAVNEEGWLLGHGWSPSSLGGWPDAQMLERAFPGRPVALYAHDHHSRWVSVRALHVAGIERATPDPPGGLIRRDDAGHPTGVLHETAANLVDPYIPEPDEAVLEADLLTTAAELAASGVTGCHDPAELDRGAGIERSQFFYRRLAAEGRLPLRVHASIRTHQLADAIGAGLRSGDSVAPAARDDPAAGRVAERYRMGWLKLFADGSLGSRSAALIDPYSDADRRPPTGGRAGMFLHSREELADQLDRAASAGIAGQVHAIGDAAVRLALDLLGELPRLALHPRIEHAQLIDPDDVPLFGQLGVAASVQPVHLRSDAQIAREAWGARADLAFPLAGLVRGGALIPCGTDAPVEPVDPWPGIAVAVVRRDPLRPADRPLGGDQAIDVARAIRAACLDPVLVAGENDRGRLVAGHRADLVVIPAAAVDDPFDAGVLATTRPLATLLDGEVVHRDPAFDA